MSVTIQGHCDRILNTIIPRHGMYFSGPLDHVIGYFAGYDAALNFKLLDGFQKFLITKYFDRSYENMHWVRLAEWAIRNGENSDEENIELFLSLLNEFLRNKELIDY